MKLPSSYRAVAYILLVFLATVLFTPKVNAEAISLEPTQDTYVDSSIPTASYGALGLGIVGYQPADSSRKALLLQFDTSSIPAGSVINSATLTLRLGGCIGTDASLGNMSFNAFLKLGGAGWSSTSTFNQIGSSGGSLELLYSKIVPCSAGSYVDFDAKDLAQNWADGVIPNDGIVLNPNTSVAYWTRVFYTKEAAASSRPKLVIDYSVPYEEVSSPDGGEIPTTPEAGSPESTTVEAQSIPEPIAPDPSLSPPTKLSATQNANTNIIELDWDKSNSENVELYRIYRLESGDEGEVTKIGEVKAADTLNFTDETAEYGKTYSYFVRSVRNNLESKNSDVVTIKVENKIIDKNLATQNAKKDSQKNTLLLLAGILVAILSAALIVLGHRHKKLHKMHKAVTKSKKAEPSA